jgi:hypothetical protein
MALLIVLLTGCLSPERFDTDWAAERCALLAECEVLDLYGHASEDACLAEAEPIADECEDFDKATASDCLDAMTAMGCSRLFSDPIPAACEQVCAGEAEGK